MHRLRRIPRTVIVALFLVVAVKAVAAHHSFAVFDHTQTVTVNGTVTKYQWTNPHGFLEMDYRAADGTMKHYTIELTSINMLTRAGWKPVSDSELAGTHFYRYTLGKRALDVSIHSARQHDNAPVTTFVHKGVAPRIGVIRAIR